MDGATVAAIVVVGVLGGLNLLLVLLALRRLREYTAKWEQAGLDQLLERKSAPKAGDRVTDFTATTIDGGTVSLRDLKGPLLAAFFSAGCSSCREVLPRFVEYGKALSGGREQVLAVVAGSAEQGADIVEAVRKVARVVVEPQTGPVSQAFNVRKWPTFVVLDRDGTVRKSAGDLREVTPARP
ncbi:TlpA family protein disulfide reductase [Nonomuraea mesophila]|uniref:TlpA family protein disulfide reductase n=1 Tax=Nonomuraea mesophila TaxID=2530382 RepID=A0A4R5FEU7_9ACTN|nr:TlpA disulfide reductase family protein [Nonomuraea mesophila]TDE47929.1 TlpA family protein disulfide reductase [Nonomuraea mesophila]